jgi:hypothetical protein
MKSLRELERDLEALESVTAKGALFFTLEDGQNVKISCGDPDGVIRVLRAAIRNEDHPYKKYIMHAVRGIPAQGQLIMTCQAIWNSHSRIAAEKAVV